MRHCDTYEEFERHLGLERVQEEFAGTVNELRAIHGLPPLASGGDKKVVTPIETLKPKRD